MKRVGILALALVLALGVLGVGYAMWDETLAVEGIVHTGEVSAVWTEAFSNDDGLVSNPAKDADDGGLDPRDYWVANGTPRYDKDAAMCIVEGSGTQEMRVTLANAYPSYHPTVIFSIDNTGTIPVKLQAMEYSVDDGTTWNSWNGTIKITVKLFGLKVVISVLHCLGVHVGDQIEPGGSAQGQLAMHIEQESEEGASGSFRVRFNLVQWNEFEVVP